MSLDTHILKDGLYLFQMKNKQKDRYPNGHILKKSFYNDLKKPTIQIATLIICELFC